jgi:hypothetical protein
MQKRSVGLDFQVTLDLTYTYKAIVKEKLAWVRIRNARNRTVWAFLTEGPETPPKKNIASFSLCPAVPPYSNTAPSVPKHRIASRFPSNHPRPKFFATVLKCTYHFIFFRLAAVTNTNRFVIRLDSPETHH